MEFCPKGRTPRVRLVVYLLSTTNLQLIEQVEIGFRDRPNCTEIRFYRTSHMHQGRTQGEGYTGILYRPPPKKMPCTVPKGLQDRKCEKSG